MPKSQDRLQLIGRSVLEQAQAERDALIAKATAYRETELGRHDHELLVQMYDKMQSEIAAIRLENTKARSGALRAVQKKLLLRREEIRAQVFADARVALRAHCEQPAYRTSLLAELRDLAGRYDHTQSVVAVNERDLPLADDIRAALGAPVEVRADAGIAIGGFRLRNAPAGVVVDETLDTRLADAAPWFLQNSGLKVV